MMPLAILPKGETEEVRVFEAEGGLDFQTWEKTEDGIMAQLGGEFVPIPEGKSMPEVVAEYRAGQT